MGGGGGGGLGRRSEGGLPFTRRIKKGIKDKNCLIVKVEIWKSGSVAAWKSGYHHHKLNRSYLQHKLGFVIKIEWFSIECHETKTKPTTYLLDYSATDLKP